MRQNGAQPQALAVIATDTASAIEQATASAVTAFNGATDGGSIVAALNLAAAVQDLRDLFSRPEILSRIQALQDTPLGFRTDRDPKIKNKKTGQPNIPYSYDVVQEAAIEAMLRGLQLVGNQFNIISGRFYCTKEGFEALIKKLDFVADFRPSIGVPQTKSGGALIECSATWLQNGKQQSLSATIPVKGDDYSSADQLIGKASRKFLRRCYEVMSGNSMPEGDVIEPDNGAVVVAPPLGGPIASVAPVLAAAAAPVATLTEQQIAQVRTAAMRQLSAVGVEAFEASICQACGVDDLSQIPAEHHQALMSRIADATNRDRWNRGCDHLSGEPILTAEQIAELLPQKKADEEPQEEAPAPAPAAQRPIRRVTQSVAPETQPEATVGTDDDDVQSELI